MADEYETLGDLVAADETAGGPQTFVLTYTGSGPAFAGHPGWPDDARVPSDVEVDELEDRGWVRVTERQGKARHFAVTGDGRRAWNARLAQLASATGRQVSLDWQTVHPVLQRIYQAYLASGAPVTGVDTLTLFGDDPETEANMAAIRELVRGDYLDVFFESAEGPRMVRPTTLTLQMEAGWPTGPAQDALDELVAALDAEIGRTSDAQKRSKLQQVRDGLVGAARDVALAYLEKKIGG